MPFFLAFALFNCSCAHAPMWRQREADLLDFETVRQAWASDYDIESIAAAECDPWTWHVHERPNYAFERLGYLGVFNVIDGRYTIWLKPGMHPALRAEVLRHEAVHALARCSGRYTGGGTQGEAHDHCAGPVWGLRDSVADRARVYRGRECHHES